jgi:hypothetical protein
MSMRMGRPSVSRSVSQSVTTAAALHCISLPCADRDSATDASSAACGTTPCASRERPPGAVFIYGVSHMMVRERSATAAETHDECMSE